MPSFGRWAKHGSTHAGYDTARALPFRTSQIHKAKLAPCHILCLQVGRLNDDTHDEVTPRGLCVHLRR